MAEADILEDPLLQETSERLKKALMSIVLNVHPGGTIGHPGGQQKKFLPFGHGMGLAAFYGTGLQNKSFQDWAEISKA